MRWHPDHKTCSHANEDACPTCDFDDYYALNYPDCPWRQRVLDDQARYLGGLIGDTA